LNQNLYLITVRGNRKGNEEWIFHIQKIQTGGKQNKIHSTKNAATQTPSKTRAKPMFSPRISSSCFL
jgi:hypothetical protein